MTLGSHLPKNHKRSFLSFVYHHYPEIMAAKEVKRLSFEEVAKVSVIDASISICSMQS